MVLQLILLLYFSPLSERRSADVVEHIDIPATILDLAHIPIPFWMTGRSLMPLLRGTELQPRPAFSMSLDRNMAYNKPIETGTVAVWDGDYKLIHYLTENKSLLFHIRKDPDELKNLFHEKPETGQRLLALLKNELEKVNGRIIRKNN